MVDSIGIQGVTAQDRLVTPVAATRQVAATTARRSEAPSEAASKQLELSALAFDFGKPSPADEARVAEVRQAVRNGTYPITPETIADRMLALKLYWTPKK